jgi:putative signal transducing protein
LPSGVNQVLCAELFPSALSSAGRRLATEPEALRELVRTNDPVVISAIEALLKGAGISHFVADQNISVLEGSIGAFQRRILVDDDEVAAARRLLTDAGFGNELRPDSV